MANLTNDRRDWVRVPLLSPRLCVLTLTGRPEIRAVVREASAAGATIYARGPLRLGVRARLELGGACPPVRVRVVRSAPDGRGGCWAGVEFDGAPPEEALDALLGSLFAPPIEAAS